MKTIIATCPDRQTRPSDVKIIVLTAERHPLNEADSPRNKRREKVPEMAHSLHAAGTIQIQSGGGGGD